MISIEERRGMKERQGRREGERGGGHYTISRLYYKFGISKAPLVISQSDPNLPTDRTPRGLQKIRQTIVGNPGETIFDQTITTGS